MNSRDARHVLGAQAERLVSDDLASRGFVIIGRNWRRPWGEIDIIARLGSVIHFIEVKAQRVSTTGFEAYRRADVRKMRTVTRTARSWLAANGHGPSVSWQVDIVELTIGGETAQLRHFMNVDVPSW